MLTKLLENASTENKLTPSVTAAPNTSGLDSSKFKANSGLDTSIDDLRKFGSLLALNSAAEPIVTAENPSQYIARTFKQTVDGSTKVQSKAQSVPDIKKELISVSRTQYKNHDLNDDFDVISVSDAKYSGRLIKDGQFYPYFNHQNKTEGPGAVAIWSINGAKVSKISVAGGKPELAEELNKIEKKYGKTIIGFRPLDFDEGWFAMIYKDKGGTIKMGQFALDGFKLNGKVDPERMRKIFHATVSSVAEHYLSKP